jgi:hypothetical protein
VWLNKSFLGHCYMEILLKVSFGRKKLFRFYCEMGESLPNSWMDSRRGGEMTGAAGRFGAELDGGRRDGSREGTGSNGRRCIRVRTTEPRANNEETC